MFTARGLLTTAVAVALAISGWVLSLPELVSVGLAVGSLVLFATLWVWVPGHRRPTLTATVDPNPAYAGSTSTVTTTVHGQSFRAGVIRGPISDGRSIRLWARSGRRHTQAGSFPLSLSVRGTLTVGPFRLSRMDPLGLMQRRLAAAAPIEVRVWPRVYPAASIPLATGSNLDRPSATSAIRNTATGSSEPAGLRPYVVGDELRLVHWAASARGRGLLVRTFDEERPTQPVVLFDDRASAHTADSFELAVEVVASLLGAPRTAGTPAPLLILRSKAHTDASWVGTNALSMLSDLTPAQTATSAVLSLTADVVVTGPTGDGGDLVGDHLSLTVNPHDPNELHSTDQLSKWTAVAR
jgi:uncharacterized protein (DUF58 family)